MFTAINDIVTNGLSGVTTLTQWPVWTIIFSVLGVGFLVLLIGLVYSIVQAVQKFRKGWSRK